MINSFIGLTFNDLDPSGTRFSRSSEFSVVKSTDIALNIPHKAHIFLNPETADKKIIVYARNTESG